MLLQLCRSWSGDDNITVEQTNHKLPNYKKKITDWDSESGRWTFYFFNLDIRSRLIFIGKCWLLPKKLFHSNIRTTSISQASARSPHFLLIEHFSNNMSLCWLTFSNLLVDSVRKALHRYLRGHGFKSRAGLNFSGITFTTA